MEIVDEWNIYIDTDRGSDDRQDMCNFSVNMQTCNLSAPENCFFRFSLVNFSMFKTFTNVNSNNSCFVLRTDAGAHMLDLTHLNYANLYDLAVNFASVITTQLLADSQALGSSATNCIYNSIKPVSSVTSAGTSNNVMSFDVQFINGTNTQVDSKITFVRVQFYTKCPMDETRDSDIYNLLGGYKLPDNTDISANSWTTTIASDRKTMSFKSYFPCQLHSCPYLYLRTDLPVKSLATGSLDSANIDKDKNDVHSSNIVAKLTILNSYVLLDTAYINQYFFDVKQRNINQFKLYLTDMHGKQIAPFGDNNDQKTRGNLHFNCVYRIQIIRELKSNQEPNPQYLNARKSQVLSELNPTHNNTFRYYKTHN